jgi:carboxymethylenebutenolidase
MPIYDPNRVEYGITSGHIQIMMEDGSGLPAYWAHPHLGSAFPAVALIHDWWGITPIIRRVAHWLAQNGYYVIVPDLFDGQMAATPEEALELVRALGENGYPRIDTALGVLENHHNTNSDVAAVGIGMGGSLAYEAAIRRPDLEAAIAFFGFPQRYFGHFAQANTPILAIYGSDEPYVLPPVIEKLRAEFAAAPISHELLILPGVGRQFLQDNPTEDQRQRGRLAFNAALRFLASYLRGPVHPPPREVL